MRASLAGSGEALASLVSGVGRGGKHGAEAFTIETSLVSLASPSDEEVKLSEERVENKTTPHSRLPAFESGAGI